MSAYFKDFNFVRAVTLLSLIGAIALGYLDWKQYHELVALRASLEHGGQVESLCQDMQILAKQYKQLDTQRQRDQSLNLKAPDAYVRNIGSPLYIAQIKVESSEDPVRNQKGLVDYNYRLRPQDAKSSFTRQQLWQFFTRLEGENVRQRLTTLRITNAKARLTPESIPDDRWTFDATLTSRQKVGQ